MNETNGQAFHRISKLIRDFETGSLTKDTSSEKIIYPDFTFNDGYYVSINPRVQAGLFMDCLFGPEKIHATKEAVYKSWLFSGYTEKFIPVSNHSFRTEHTNRIGMVKTVDPLAGEVIHFDKLVMKQIPAFVVFGQLTLLAVWAFLLVTSMVVWTGYCIQAFIKGKSKTLVLCTYPAATSLMFVLLFILVTTGLADTDAFLARPGILSTSILVISVLIPITSAWSFIAIYKARNLSINRGIFLVVSILSGLHLVVTVYLIWFEVFPIVTWS